MNRMPYLTLLALLLFIVGLSATPSYSTCYYLSEKGNDTNSGTTANAPWRSLQKLQSQMVTFQPGDSILLERGSKFVGSLQVLHSGSADKRIYIGAYGDGEHPVITGAIRITKWKSVEENIWKASIEAKPGDLFINKARQPLGRFPDKGYLTANTDSLSDSLLHDPGLDYENGYWNRAEVVVKSSRWTLDVLPVKSYTSHTFHFETPSSYPLTPQVEYFIQNHLLTLSSQGEWYFDAQRQEIFLHSDSDPGQQLVEVSTYDEGIKVANADFITIEGIAFKNQRMVGVRLQNSHDIAFINNSISLSGKNGLDAASCKNIQVQNNRISDCNNNGVEWTNNTNAIFTDNSVLRTGLSPGRGASGNGTYIGMFITGGKENNSLIQYNTFDSTGYTALDFRTGNTQIRKNFIRSFCLVKDDGGGIYTWGNSAGQNIIESNIIIGAIKDNLATTKETFAYGIYIDDKSQDVAVLKNTVAYCEGAGLLIHNVKDIVVRGNQLLGNGNNFLNKEKAQLIIKRDDLVPEDELKIENIMVMNNTFVNTREDQRCLLLHFKDKKHITDAATFEGNNYITFDKNIVRMAYSELNSLCDAHYNLTFKQWQQFSGTDKKSKVKLSSYQSLMVMNNSKRRLLTNNWTVWPEGATLDLKKRSDHTFTLDVTPPAGEQQEVLVYRPGFELDKDKIYRLYFSVQSPHDGEMEFVPMLSTAPWEALADYQCFKTGETVREFNYYFKPVESSKQARLNFKSNQPIQISNIRLNEVRLNSYVNDIIKLMYNTNKAKLPVQHGQTYFDLDGKKVDSLTEIPPYESIILFRFN